VFASAARTGRPASRTVVPSGGAGPPGGSIWERISSIRSCWSESGWTRIPNATSAVSPIGVPPEGLHSPRWLITICEMKQGSDWTSACTSPTLWLGCELDEAPLEDEAPPKKSVSERAGQIWACAQLGAEPENP
jgi:hypothetical protein